MCVSGEQGRVTRGAGVAQWWERSPAWVHVADFVQYWLPPYSEGFSLGSSGSPVFLPPSKPALQIPVRSTRVKDLHENSAKAVVASSLNIEKSFSFIYLSKFRGGSRKFRKRGPRPPIPPPPPPQMKTVLFRTCSLQHCGQSKVTLTFRMIEWKSML